jgi:DNA modification methylase
MQNYIIENFETKLINEFLEIRNINLQGLKILRENILANGYNKEFNLTVSKSNNNYKLIAGRHRYEILKELNIKEVPVIVYENLSYNEELKIARQSNTDVESFIPTTFIDDAELIWRELKNNKEMTQEKLGVAMGWSRDKVQGYFSLNKIHISCWQLIKSSVATISKKATDDNETNATLFVANATLFTEGLLRDIINIYPSQQRSLCKQLIENKITKGKFKQLAKAFKVRNELLKIVVKELTPLYDEEAFKKIITKAGEVKLYIRNYAKKALQQIQSGYYDNYEASFKLDDNYLNKLDNTSISKEIIIKLKTMKSQKFNNENDFVSYLEKIFGKTEIDIYENEFLKNINYEDVKVKDKFNNLINSFKDEWEKKNGIKLINGDFYEKVKDVKDYSVNLIITDPPYFLNDSRVFKFKDTNGKKTRNDITNDMGEWDKESPEQIRRNIKQWLIEFQRILVENGSGYIFTSDRYISYFRDIIDELKLKYKHTLTWCKTNPPPQTVKTNWNSANEYVIFFTKCESGHTFHYGNENEMKNYFECAICGGNERLKDKNLNTLHPTQKPEQIIQKLMEVSSVVGDVIFDGFMGVGTVPAVCKKLNRKCIGIEKDEVYYNAAQNRLKNKGDK